MFMMLNVYNLHMIWDASPLSVAVTFVASGIPIFQESKSPTTHSGVALD